MLCDLCFVSCALPTLPERSAGTGADFGRTTRCWDVRRCWRPTYLSGDCVPRVAVLCEARDPRSGESSRGSLRCTGARSGSLLPPARPLQSVLLDELTTHRSSAQCRCRPWIAESSRTALSRPLRFALQCSGPRRMLQGRAPLPKSDLSSRRLRLTRGCALLYVLCVLCSVLRTLPERSAGIGTVSTWPPATGKRATVGARRAPSTTAFQASLSSVTFRNAPQSSEHRCQTRVRRTFRHAIPKRNAARRARDPGRGAARRVFSGKVASRCRGSA